MKFNKASSFCILTFILSLTSSALAMPTTKRRAPMPAIQSRKIKTVQPEHTDFHTYTYTAHEASETEYYEWDEDTEGWELDVGIDVLKKRQLVNEPVPVVLPTPGVSVPSAVTDPIDSTFPPGPYIVVIDEDGNELPVEVIPLPEIPPDMLQENASTEANATTSNNVTVSETPTPTTSTGLDGSNSNATTTASSSATPSTAANFVNNFARRGVSATTTLPLPSGFAAPTAPIPGVLPPLLVNGTVPTTTATATN